MAEPFYSLTSTGLPLRKENVDTDQVIPARFLKGISKEGLGEHLFHDWRYLKDGKTDNPDFVLNNPKYSEASILIADDNFGCGSSREHAPWSILDEGFMVILAPSFADIFKNNALKNGLIPISLDVKVIHNLFDQVEKEPETSITVDLKDQQVTIADGAPIPFEIDAFRKKCLLEGLDDIGYTMKHLADIEQHEKTHASAF